MDHSASPPEDAGYSSILSRLTHKISTLKLATIATSSRKHRRSGSEYRNEYLKLDVSKEDHSLPINHASDTLNQMSGDVWTRHASEKKGADSCIRRNRFTATYHYLSPLIKRSRTQSSAAGSSSSLSTDESEAATMTSVKAMEPSVVVSRYAVNALPTSYGSIPGSNLFGKSTWQIDGQPRGQGWTVLDMPWSMSDDGISEADRILFQDLTQIPVEDEQSSDKTARDLNMYV